MSLTNRCFCRIMTLLTFPRKPLGFIQRLMVEESLENPIGLQTGKTCNRQDLARDFKELIDKVRTYKSKNF